MEIFSSACLRHALQRAASTLVSTVGALHAIPSGVSVSPPVDTSVEERFHARRRKCVNGSEVLFLCPANASGSFSLSPPVPPLGSRFPRPSCSHTWIRQRRSRST